MAIQPDISRPQFQRQGSALRVSCSFSGTSRPPRDGTVQISSRLHYTGRSRSLDRFCFSVSALCNPPSTFPDLVRRWHQERSISSSLSEITSCAAYREIIGMGRNALPRIFNQIRSEGNDPDHWHTALEAITGENPVSPDMEGDTVAIAQAWLRWAEQNDVA